MSDSELSSSSRSHSATPSPRHKSPRQSPTATLNNALAEYLQMQMKQHAQQPQQQQPAGSAKKQLHETYGT